MEHYKLLNMQLIRELQKLKQLNSISEQIITETKGELMRERALHVEQQQRLKSFVMQKFCEIMQVINHETDLNDLLSSDKENNSPRTSNVIFENFEHSLQAVRRSSVTLSPLPKRRTTVPESVSEDSSVCEVESDDGENDSNDNQNQEQNEEVDSDDGEDDSNVSHNQEQNEEAPAEMEEEEISEITNGAERLSMLAEENEEDEAEQQNDDISTLKNNTNNCPITITIPSTAEDMVLRSLQNINSESNSQLSMPLSFPAPNNSHLVCSTPRKFSDESTNTQLCATAHNETATLQKRSRPRRKCAPINLKERSLKIKLSNDSSCSNKTDQSENH